MRRTEQYFDLLIYGEELSGGLDSAPSALRNMQQAVNAADVNKHTEINDPADRAHDLHAGSEAVPNCFLCGFCFGKENSL